MIRFALLAMTIAFSACTTVDPGTTGVSVLFGTPSTELMEPGFHTTGFASVTHVSLKEYPMAFEGDAFTEDNQEISYNLTVITQMTEAGAFDFVTETTGLYEGIIPAKVKSQAAIVIKGRDVWTVNSERETVAAEIQALLVSELAPYGIDIRGVEFTDMNIDPDFRESIQRRQRAEVDASTAIIALEQETTATQLQVATAQARAEASILSATAAAEAIDLEGAALRRNPQILELRRVETWNGVLPTTLVKGSSAPLLEINR
jgi:regulator of protease activity HflC (stomatin/prohibitin superfamily)